MDHAQLQRRIIDDADKYHFIAEEQWKAASELEPTDDESFFEFLRLVRAGLRFYIRAYLVLDMIETDDEQDLEELLEIVCEENPELAELVAKNDVVGVLNEEAVSDYSRSFSVAESMRAFLLQHSNQLAATLHRRFLEED